jgi:diguanylate cyclase (GGDEF)-like protein
MQELSQPDYRLEGRNVDIKLLRGLALGGHRSVEIQLLFDSLLHDGSAALGSSQARSFEALALLLTDVSVSDSVARETFGKLARHMERMEAALGRAVGIKAAAMDYVEQLERALNLREEEHALTYRQLAQLAFNDHLTGLANFRYFDQRLQEEIKRADRYRKQLSLLMIDLDWFKQFNDAHGHPAGNRALEHVSDMLRQSARETDLVARFGGEEFAVLLPETSKHEAGILAERIRYTAENTPVELPDGAQKLTVSVGYATFPRDAHTVLELQEHADKALYKSKELGRNRATAFEPDTQYTFAFAPDSAHPASMVHVVGDFNGWSPNVDALRRNSDHILRLMLRLEPGVYEYKYVLDGERYTHDPGNPQSVPDGFGGMNSVAVVK